jgi:uncharacterized protein (TIGR01244 family)
MTMFKTIGLMVLMALLSACAITSSLDSEAVIHSGVKNIRVADGHLFTSGQPSHDQLKQLNKAGIVHVVNLRPKSEQSWDEQAAIEALGMHYHNIPIGGLNDLTTDNAKALAQLFTAIGAQPSLLHCASGNRVGALVAVMEAELKGKSVDDAIAEGRRWGLTRLAPLVRDKLSTP